MWGEEGGWGVAIYVSLAQAPADFLLRLYKRVGGGGVGVRRGYGKFEFSYYGCSSHLSGTNFLSPWVLPTVWFAPADFLGFPPETCGWVTENQIIQNQISGL